jgi:hypothetical protein
MTFKYVQSIPTSERSREDRELVESWDAYNITEGAVAELAQNVWGAATEFKFFIEGAAT